MTDACIIHVNRRWETDVSTISDFFIEGSTVKGFILEEKLKASDGLGLSNLQKRTLMMDGNFIINSNPGVGTEIQISIPYS